MVFFDQHPHPGIQTLHPYVPGQSIQALQKKYGLDTIIKLASNENPLGCSSAVTRTLNALSNQDYAHYLITQEHPFRQQLAEYLGLNPTMIFLSNGSDAIFNLCLICFALHHQKKIITHEKAFIQYELQAQTLGIRVEKIPVHSNYQVHLQALSKACQHGASMLFLANPNNPTGYYIPPDEMTSFLKTIPKEVIIVLDEAYYEYVPSAQQSPFKLWLVQHPNLIITRTFSKIYGLAALRLGYAMANPELISWLYRIQLPFFVNLAALKAAEAALQDQAFVQKSIDINQEGMLQLKKAFDTLKLSYVPSAGNFLTFATNSPAQEICLILEKQGVIVRPLGSYGLYHHIRVTIGTKEQNHQFISALEYALKNIENRQ